MDSAAAKARDDLVHAGDSVSAWKVSQAVLVQLKVDSWSSLGFHLLDVPSIRHLTAIEGKVYLLFLNQFSVILLVYLFISEHSFVVSGLFR